MHTEAPVGVHEESVKRGHELDPIDPKPFIQFTVVMLVLFLGVWVICSYLLDNGVVKWTPDAKANRTTYDGKKPNPLAAEVNNKSLDERFRRIDTYSPVSSTGNKTFAPRLEALRVRDFEGQPEYLRSVTRQGAGNSPEYHPEDLHAERIPELRDGKWVDEAKGIARLPVAAVIANAKSMGLTESLFKTQKNAKTEYNAEPGSHRPKLSNAGRGIAESKATEEEKKH